MSRCERGPLCTKRSLCDAGRDAQTVLVCGVCPQYIDDSWSTPPPSARVVPFGHRGSTSTTYRTHVHGRHNTAPSWSGLHLKNVIAATSGGLLQCARNSGPRRANPPVDTVVWRRYLRCVRRSIDSAVARVLDGGEQASRMPARACSDGSESTSRGSGGREQQHVNVALTPAADRVTGSSSSGGDAPLGQGLVQTHTVSQEQTSNREDAVAECTRACEGAVAPALAQADVASGSSRAAHAAAANRSPTTAVGDAIACTDDCTDARLYEAAGSAAQRARGADIGADRDVTDACDRGGGADGGPSSTSAACANHGSAVAGATSARFVPLSAAGTPPGGGTIHSQSYSCVRAPQRGDKRRRLRMEVENAAERTSVNDRDAGSSLADSSNSAGAPASSDRSVNFR